MTFWSDLVSAQLAERQLPPPSIPQPQPPEPAEPESEPVAIDQSTSMRDYARARADLGLPEGDVGWMNARQPRTGSEIVPNAASKRHWGQGGRQVMTDIGLFGLGERELRGEVHEAIREHRFDYSGTGEGVLDSGAASGIGARGPTPPSALTRAERARWR